MSKVHLSPIVAGCWRLLEWQHDTPALVRWIEQAVALGITSFDHADIYGDYAVEAAFGAALRSQPGLRDRLQIVTKCGIRLVSPARPAHALKSYDSSRAHLMASVEQSLRALHTDRIDLLLIHRPDLLMEPDELAETFRVLQASGKALNIGLSNHSASQFALLHRRFPALATHQFEFSALQMGALSDGTLEQALDLRLPPMAWSPLGGGRLASGEDAQALRVRNVLAELGRARGVSAATMAYAWIRRHPASPIPITGSGRIEALREAAAALQVRVTAEEWYRVWQAGMGHEVP
jgi:predicted oxidoreductase